MAYSFTVNLSCANRAAAVAEIWTRLVAMGWSLHDNQDGSSYRVYKSNGENSDRIYEYIKVDWITANRITFNAYGYWNASTQTGSNAASGGYYITSSESGMYLWIHGDKSLVHVEGYTSSYTHVLFGHLPTIYWATPVTALTQAASSGSSVTIHVTSTTVFVAGNYYQIFGAAGEGRDKVQVSSITNGTDMVIASLPRNYGSGSYIGLCPSSFGISDCSTFNNTCPWTTAGTGAAAGGCARYPVLAQAYESTDVRIALDMLQPLIYQQTYASNYGIIGYSNAYILNAYNSSYATQDTFAVTSQDTGTAESGGNSTLTDTDKAWSTNAWANKVVIITFGTGIGQIKKIASNTGTVLTISDTWTINPSSDSQYMICDEGYRVFDITSTSYGVACREGV